MRHGWSYGPSLPERRSVRRVEAAQTRMLQRQQRELVFFFILYPKSTVCLVHSCMDIQCTRIQKLAGGPMVGGTAAGAGGAERPQAGRRSG